MSATHEEFRQQMAGVVADLALNFALRPDEEVVQALKALRTGFAEEYQKLFSDSAEEADQVAVDLLRLVVQQRHELERHGSVVSRAIH